MNTNKKIFRITSAIGLSSILLLQGCSNIGNIWFNQPIEVNASSHPEKDSAILKPDASPSEKNAIEAKEGLNESESVDHRVEALEKAVEQEDVSKEKTTSTEDKKEEIHKVAVL